MEFEETLIHYEHPIHYFKEDVEIQKIMLHHMMKEVEANCFLTSKMQGLLVLTALCINHGKDRIKEHIQNLLDMGIDPFVIQETLYHCIPYAGLIVVDQALEEMHSVWNKRNIHIEKEVASLDDAQRYAQGYHMQITAFDEATIQQGYTNAKEDTIHFQKFLTAHCFGDFYTRSALDLQQRELLTFGILASLGGCEKQLYAHVGANLHVGNSRKDLLSAITCLQPYIGFPRTLNALQIINEVTNQKKEKETAMKTKTIFPIGEKNTAYEQYFIGQSYLNMLVKEPMSIANVTFEPGCRNHWHIHHKSGQILLVTNGTGWYQEWGKAARKLKAGDVVNIPAEIKHWHGATKDSWFSHIAIEVPAQGASNEWLEAVEEEAYQALPIE